MRSPRRRASSRPRTAAGIGAAPPAAEPPSGLRSARNVSARSTSRRPGQGVAIGDARLGTRGPRPRPTPLGDGRSPPICEREVLGGGAVRQRATTSPIQARLAGSDQSVSGSLANGRADGTERPGPLASRGGPGCVGAAADAPARPQRRTGSGPALVRHAARPGLQAEEVVQEVLGRGILVQPAHEIGDRAVEVFGLHDRRVEQAGRPPAPAPPAPDGWPCPPASRTRPDRSTPWRSRSTIP